jgi:AcrR family transcriptional regulator
VKKREPREHILQEATRLIAQRGFGAISVNDVAQAVGISKQALLYHYPSREALHEAVVASLIEHSNRHLLLLLGAFSGKGEEPWLRLMADTLRQGQQEGRIRRELDPEAAVAHVGTLLLTTFALLPLEGWTGVSNAEWRERSLGEVVRIIERYLFTSASPEPKGPGRPAASRRQTK